MNTLEATFRILTTVVIRKETRRILLLSGAN